MITISHKLADFLAGISRYHWGLMVGLDGNVATVEDGDKRFVAKYRGVVENTGDGVLVQNIKLQSLLRLADFCRQQSVELDPNQDRLEVAGNGVLSGYIQYEKRGDRHYGWGEVPEGKRVSWSWCDWWKCANGFSWFRNLDGVIMHPGIITGMTGVKDEQFCVSVSMCGHDSSAVAVFVPVEVLDVMCYLREKYILGDGAAFGVIQDDSSKDDRWYFCIDGDCELYWRSEPWTSLLMPRGRLCEIHASRDMLLELLRYSPTLMVRDEKCSMIIGDGVSWNIAGTVRDVVGGLPLWMTMRDLWYEAIERFILPHQKFVMWVCENGIEISQKEVRIWQTKGRR